MNLTTNLKAQNEELKSFDLTQYKASCQKKVYYTQELQIVTLDQIFETIRGSEELQSLVNVLRGIKDDTLQKKYKKNYIPYFNLGTFHNSCRINKNLMSSSFFIFDYDNLYDNLEDVKARLISDESVFSVFVSPRGNGLKAIYRLDRPITDYLYFSGLYKHYAKKCGADLGAEPDKTSDASRACFFSYDPDIYVNSDAVPLNADVALEESTSFRKNHISENFSNTSVDLDLLADVVEYMSGLGKISYNDWIACGFSLASLGEDGREFFLKLSSNPNYNDTIYELNARFSNFLRHEDKINSLETLYFIAARYGFRFLNIVQGGDTVC